MVTAKRAYLALYAPFLMRLHRRAKLRRELPMRSKRDEACVFVSGIAAHHFLYSACQVIVAQGMKHTAEVGKGGFMRLEESLLRRMKVSPVKCTAALHAAHIENLHLGLLAVENNVALIPIDLRLLAPVITLRNTNLCAG